MKKANLLLVFALSTAAALAACTGGGGGGGGDTAGGTTPPPPPTVTPATPGTVMSPNPKPITAFLQTVNNSSNTGEYFPGQLNIWDIDSDFDLTNDQFIDAQSVTVGVSDFMNDQQYSELTFYSPAMSGADGVKVASVANGVTIGPAGYGTLNGFGSAFLNATSDSRLSQTVSLPSSTTCTLTWVDNVALEAGSFPGYTPSFSVVARDVASGNTLTTFFTTTTIDPLPSHTVDLTDLAGTTFVLSFENHGAPVATGPTFAIVDDVSIMTVGDRANVANGGTGTDLVANGNFENGETSWNKNTPTEVQNMTSGQRTLEGLTITRSFYTVPNKAWGRWTDVFENKTAGSISKTITYVTTLTAGATSSVYLPISEAKKRALTAWDTTAYTTDLGLVFGNATSVDYRSASAIGAADGSDTVTVTYDITVPAGGRAVIVNFAIMDGTYTGKTATAITSKAADVDTAAYSILIKFWSDAQYRDGMTQQQMDAITNF